MLHDIRAHRLVSAPRPPADADSADPLPPQLFAALTAAHVELASAALSRPLLLAAWERPPGQAALRVVFGGRPSFPPATLPSTAGVPPDPQTPPDPRTSQTLPGQPTPHAPPGQPDPEARPGQPSPEAGHGLQAPRTSLGALARDASSGTLAPAAQPGSLLYPPGSTAVEVDGAELVEEWRRYPAWVRCLGHTDPLWTPGSAQSLRAVGRGGFDDYVSHLATPFVWLVIAEPVDAATLGQQLATLETAIPGLRQRESSEKGRVTLERAQARYRELSRARGAGAWRVHVVVGGPSAIAARSTAAVLCSSSELDDLPYALVPGGDATDLDTALSADGDGEPGGQDQPRAPFVATSELLAALARPPRRETPGVRLVEPADFDVTPEIDGEIHLGDVLDAADRPVGPFTVGAGTLNRHTFVAGATGSGKSQTVRHLLEQLSGAGVPWLAIEPAKSEYAAMAGRIGDGGSDGGSDGRVLVIRPGDPDAVPVGFNPLEPEAGFPLQTHLDLVRALFLAAFEADEPFPQVLGHALERCYRERGWDPVASAPVRSGRPPRYPRLGDLQQTALDVVDGIGYGREVADNVRGFIDVRLSSLRLGTPGRFFEGGQPLDVGDLMARNVVLEIEDIGADEDKAFFIGAVLIRVYEHLRVRRPCSIGLTHVTVLEEAHRLLRRVEPGSPAAHAIELFTSLLAEVRAYGEGIVVAEQIPGKIVPDVVKNTALKIVHRLPAADDRALVGATMNLSDAQSRHVVTLPPGRAAVFADGMDRPIRVAVPLGESREHRPSAPAATTALTLRQLNEATHLAGDDQLVLWIELLTAAHIVGRPAPLPLPSWRHIFLGRASRPIVDAALTHAVEVAVDARYLGLAGYYAPEALADHLTACASRILDGGPSCTGDEPEWQAGRYRWIDVLWSLRNDQVPTDRPHPATASWTARGLDLPGPTIADQLAQLRAHPDYWRPSPTIVTGTGAFPRALARLSPAGSAEARFSQATHFLEPPTRWPPIVFRLTDAQEHTP